MMSRSAADTSLQVSKATLHCGAQAGHSIVPPRMQLVICAVSSLACQEMCYIDLAIGIHLMRKRLKHRAQVRFHCLQAHTHMLLMTVRQIPIAYRVTLSDPIGTARLLTSGTIVHSAHCGMSLALPISSATMSCRQLCRYPGKSGMT
jgi:hypothetical protein